MQVYSLRLTFANIRPQATYLSSDVVDNKLWIKLLCHMQQIDPQTRTVPNSCFSSVSLKHQRKSGESDLKIMPYCSVLYIPHLFETWVWKLLPHCEDTWCRALSVYHSAQYSSWSMSCSSLSCRHWVLSGYTECLSSSIHSIALLHMWVCIVLCWSAAYTWLVLGLCNFVIPISCSYFGSQVCCQQPLTLITSSQVLVDDWWSVSKEVQKTIWYI